jgi:hypothetical protein
MQKVLVFLFLSLSSLWASAPTIQGTIILLNDSPYILTAGVYANSGDYLGQVTLQPGEQKNFTTNFSQTNLNRPGFPDVSITPYRIIWTCGSGSIYSMCRDGSVGALIRASECSGVLYCTPTKEKSKTPPPSEANNKPQK